MDLLKPFFGVGFWQVSLKTPGLDQGLSYPCPFRDIDIALMSWPGLPNFYAWWLVMLSTLAVVRKIFRAFLSWQFHFREDFHRRLEKKRPCWAWVCLNALANLSLSQPLRTQAGIGMVHPPRMSVSSHRAKHDAVVICGHTWSWCSPVSSKTWACVFFFFFAFSPWAPSIVCTGSGMSEGRLCQGF